MSERLEKTQKSDYAVATVVGAAILLLVILAFCPHDDMKFDNESCVNVESSCNYTTVTGKTLNVFLPAKLLCQEGNSVTVEYTIPKDWQDVYAICIRTSQQSLEVFCEGKEIYSYGTNPAKIAIGKSPGSAWNVIRLPANSTGKTFSLRITAFDDFHRGKVNQIYAGTKAALLFLLLKENFFNFLISAIVFFIGIGLLFGRMALHKLVKDGRQMDYIGAFAVLVSIWLFSESKMSQFFIGNQLVMQCATFLSLSTFILPILQYVASLEDFHYAKFLHGITYFLCAETVVVALLQIFNVFQYYDMVFWIQSMRVLASIAIIMTLFLEIFEHHNKKIKEVAYSLTFLGVCAIADFATFYITGGSFVGFFLKIGILVFVISLARVVIQHSISVSKLSQEAGYYAEMAKSDQMTGLKNKAAYLEAVTAQNEAGTWKNCAVMVVDINNLKEINDQFGHCVGDDAIVHCATALCAIYGKWGEGYRIGGDEFAFIFLDPPKMEWDALSKAFLQKCEQSNRSTPYLLVAALGYGTYEQDSDCSLQDIAKRADCNMYSAKEEWKRKRVLGIDKLLWPE